MDEVHEQQLGSDTTVKSSTPPFPATTAEYITVLAHFHRAEMGRMAGWRDRIDRTTNWAITGVAAMLSLSLSRPHLIMACSSSPWCWCNFCFLSRRGAIAFSTSTVDGCDGLEKYYFAQILAPSPRGG